MYKNFSECFEIGANFIIYAIKQNQKIIYYTDSDYNKELTNRIETFNSVENISKLFKLINVNKKLKKNITSKRFLKLLRHNFEEIKDKNSTKRVLINFSKSPKFTNLINIDTLAHLNILCTKNSTNMMCQFEIGKITSLDLLNILKTYPRLIENDYVFNSPFYIEPSEIISETLSDREKIKSLTEKEIKILRSIVNGLSNRKINSKFCSVFFI